MLCRYTLVFSDLFSTCMNLYKHEESDKHILVFSSIFKILCIKCKITHSYFCLCFISVNRHTIYVFLPRKGFNFMRFVTDQLPNRTTRQHLLSVYNQKNTHLNPLLKILICPSGLSS